MVRTQKSLGLCAHVKDYSTIRLVVRACVMLCSLSLYEYVCVNPPGEREMRASLCLLRFVTSVVFVHHVHNIR